MRFKLDENLPEEAATLLVSSGHEVATVLEQGLGGSSDAVVAAVCQQEGRALLTLDLDFADIYSYQPAEYSGIIVLRPASQSKHRVLELLARVTEHLKVEQLSGALMIVDESGIRIRT
jgi:predicted nuclease of predicted toxin-antitoxin system